jgi:hypothetical protein
VGFILSWTSFMVVGYFYSIQDILQDYFRKNILIIATEKYLLSGVFLS